MNPLILMKSNHDLIVWQKVKVVPSRIDVIHHSPLMKIDYVRNPL